MPEKPAPANPIADPNEPGKVGLFVPPDDLLKGEERVDSLEGRPWHMLNRSRELIERAQRGEVVPGDARAIRGVEKAVSFTVNSFHKP